MDQLMEEMTNPESVRIASPGLPQVAEENLRSLFLLHEILEDGGVAAIIPGEMRFF